MKRQSLILLTAGFPFGRHEPFLEAEVPHLAREFEQVYLFSEVDGQQAKSRRAVPENVSVTDVILPVRQNQYDDLASDACEFSVMATEFWHCIRDCRLVPLRSAWSSFSRYWRNAAQIARHVEASLVETAFDPQSTVIYSYWLTPSALAACFLKKRFPGIQAISRCHGWDVYYERSQLNYLPLRPYMFAQLDKVYCISGHGASYLDAKTRSRFSEKLEVRYLGTRDPEFTCDRSDPHERRLRIVSCSWMVGVKRLPLLIDTIAALGAMLPEHHVEWTHLGGGDDWDKTTAYAEQRIKAIETVQFDFKGNMGNQEVLAFYQHAKVDLFLSGSEWEGLPVSMMEAAAYGIPIIATDVGGVSEVVCDGQNGFLVPRDVTPRDFAEMIVRFVELPDELRAEFRVAARQTWQKKFNADQNFSDWSSELAHS